MGDIPTAETHYNQAVVISFEIVQSVINVLSSMGVCYVVAPYEADAQLAYLSTNNLVDVVISDDSDMIAYECNAVLFKLDHQGYGDLISFASIFETGLFANWSTQQFRIFCCLLGCDYIERIRSIGWKTSFSIVQNCDNVEEVVRYLHDHPGLLKHAPLGYFAKLIQALWTFEYHTVYDFKHRSMRHLNFPSESNSLFHLSSAVDTMGSTIPHHVVEDLVHGNINPRELHEKRHHLESLESQPILITPSNLRVGHNVVGNAKDSMKHPPSSHQFISPYLSRKFNFIVDCMF